MTSSDCVTISRTCYYHEQIPRRSAEDVLLFTDQSSWTGFRPLSSDVNKDLTLKAKAKDSGFKAKDSTFKAKAKDFRCVLKDSSRPRTKAKDNNTASICNTERSLNCFHPELKTFYFSKAYLRDQAR